jgi:hypothetical protein
MTFLPATAGGLLRIIPFLEVYSLLGAGGQHPDLTLARLA